MESRSDPGLEVERRIRNLEAEGGADGNVQHLRTRCPRSEFDVSEAGLEADGDGHCGWIEDREGDVPTERDLVIRRALRIHAGDAERGAEDRQAEGGMRPVRRRFLSGHEFGVTIDPEAEVAADGQSGFVSRRVVHRLIEELRRRRRGDQCEGDAGSGDAPTDYRHFQAPGRKVRVPLSAVRPTLTIPSGALVGI